MRITKRNGKSEEFNIAKVKRSLQNAGEDEITAKEIAQMVSDKECGTTSEIRSVVFEELRLLRNIDLEIAKKYDESRCLVARRAIETARGTALLSEEMMEAMHLEPGGHLKIINGHQKHTLNVYVNNETDAKCNEIRLNQADLVIIDASDGKEIIAQRNCYSRSLIQYLYLHNCNNGGGHNENRVTINN